MSKMSLVSTCVIAKAVEVYNYDSSSREIKIETAISRIGVPELRSVFPFYNWTLRDNEGLRMKDDYAIKASSGIFRGKKTVCIEWSAIHHFFQEF